MTQYSCIAVSPKAFTFEDPHIILDKGRNIFNLLTNDLEDALSRLRREGVTVLRTDAIAQDPVELSHLTLPGESVEDLLKEL